MSIVCACRPAPTAEPVRDGAVAPARFWPDPRPAPERYLLDSKPFSPTLAHLFDSGRLVVLPADKVGAPPEWSVARGYAMSAVDRYGRVYHFDEAGAWWMDAVAPLPKPLPAQGWDAAWNPVQGTLEILVTEPWAGSDKVQLLWRSGRSWRPFEIPEPPAAHPAMTRLMLADRGNWLIGGGGTLPLRLDRRRWVPWPGGQEAAKPNLRHLGSLLGQSLDGSVVLMLDDGSIWIRRAESWQSRPPVQTQGLILARCIPPSDQLLLVWSGAIGTERIATIPLAAEAAEILPPHTFSQISQIRINEDDTGDWVGWGRWQGPSADAPTTAGTFGLGPGAGGELAIKTVGENEEQQVYRARDVQLLELPPALTGLRQDAAIYVPALNGLVVPTNEGLGLEHRRVPFSRAITGENDPTSATAPTIDLIRRTYRFWVFRGDVVEFFRPAYEIHPAIGHPHSYRTPDGTLRNLSWIWPGPDTIRYEYHATTEQNEQWLPSETLTLRGIPQLDRKPGSQIFLCNPVVWGSPAQVVLVGWSGRLSELHHFPKRVKNLQDEAYSEIPTRGFVARITALEPTQWEVSPLPVTFCQGARLVVDSVNNQLYLVGGKHAVEDEVDGKKYQFMIANEDLWQWDGQDWRRIVPEGSDPPMKITSDLAYNPGARLLLNLTPRGFHGFENGHWHELWRGSSEDRWPDQMGLYVHPGSLQTLGIWFMDTPQLRVWSGRDWIPVDLPDGYAGLPDKRENLLPAMHGDGFVVVDSERIAALRMNAARDRDLDRRLNACELKLKPVGELKYPGAAKKP
ncbi:MAG: hypothetical protein ABFD69_09250 [Candidatus Sumerlaeia bacterium]